MMMMMSMNVRKKLASLACAVLPVAGFLLSCAGAYLMSLQISHYAIRVILGYVLIACGFLAMLTGVSWAICHGMKIKINHQRGGRGRGCTTTTPQHQQQLHIYTIDRPSSFPPSYEESQRSHGDDTATDSVVVVDEESLTTMGPAPPLYTQHDGETPDCAWSWEQPPPYVQTQTGLQGRLLAAGAEEQREAGVA